MATGRRASVRACSRWPRSPTGFRRRAKAMTSPSEARYAAHWADPQRAAWRDGREPQATIVGWWESPRLAFAEGARVGRLEGFLEALRVMEGIWGPWVFDADAAARALERRASA